MRVRPSEMSGAEIWVGDPAAVGRDRFEIGNLRFENESGAVFGRGAKAVAPGLA